MEGRRRLGRPGVGCPGERVEVVPLGKSGGALTLRLRTSPFQDEAADITLPGKAPKLQLVQTVPKTDTGGQDENSQALERTRVKELGKIAP